MSVADDEIESKLTAGSQAPRPPSVERVRSVATLFEIPVGSDLLVEALTHPSYAHEVPEAKDNQRLEFLGDAVLGLCVSDALLRRFGEAQEGQLTRTRAQIVSTQALSDFARSMALSEAMRFGKGAEQTDLRESSKILADAVEALIAACYLESGIAVARRVCERIIDAGLDPGRAGARDPKSELQEKVQALRLPAPVYRIVQQRGPAHRTEFVVEALVSGRSVGRGTGRSRRAAETAAAEKALAEGNLDQYVREVLP